MRNVIHISDRVVIKNPVSCTEIIVVTFPLQPLIVTPGWCVNYHQFHDVDPSVELVTDLEAYIFKEDIYQARHERYDRMIDLGWYPENDFDNGRFRLVMYSGDFHGTLLRKCESKHRAEIVDSMNDWFTLVSNGNL